MCFSPAHVFLPIPPTSRLSAVVACEGRDGVGRPEPASSRAGRECATRATLLGGDLERTCERTSPVQLQSHVPKAQDLPRLYSRVE